MIEENQVRAVYIALLGREPESEAVLHHAMRFSNVENLSAEIRRTDEFRRHVTYKSLERSAQKWVCSTIRNGLRIWIDLQDYGVAAGVLRNDWESSETDFMLSVLRQGDGFVDVGANVGWFTLIAADAVGPLGVVYSFEPRRDIFEKLALSVSENKFEARCVLHGIALGAESGTAQIGAIPSEQNPGHSFLLNASLESLAISYGVVAVSELDSIEITGSIRLIKIDVEGAEWLVLTGARRFFQRHRPIVMMEVFPEWLRKISGVEAQAVFELFEELGYRLFALEDGAIGRELHSLVGLKEGEYFNVVALAPEHCLELLNGNLDRRVIGLERQICELTDQLILERSRNGVSESNISDIGQSQSQSNSVKDLLDAAEARVASLESTNALLQTELAKVSRLAREFSNTLGETGERLVSADASVQSVNGRMAAIAAQLSAVQGALDFATNRLNLIEQSTWWKATGPFRRLGGRLPPGLRKALRRAAKLVWWTTTFQLPARLRDRERARRQQQSVSSNSVCIDNRSFRELCATSKPMAFIIDDRWPQPDRDGGSIDAVNMVVTLKKFGYHVVFSIVREGDFDPDYRRRLEEIDVTCVLNTAEQGLSQFISKYGSEFTIVVLNRVTAGGAYFEAVRSACTGAKIIFNTVDLHFLREERQANLIGDPAALAQAQGTRGRELFLAAASDATIVVSSAEKAILEQSVPGCSVLELPLARPLPRKGSGYAQRKNVGFIGGFAHAPNVDAVKYFLAEIWPAVIEQIPECRFQIVGAGLEQEIIAGAINVDYLGHLPDIDPWFSSLRLSVAPLRYGAGMKGKVISSLAAGVPCIATSIAVEGTKLVDGSNILIANSSEKFAQRIVDMYVDALRWIPISEQGVRYAQAENSIDAYQRRLFSLMARLERPALNF